MSTEEDEYLNVDAEAEIATPDATAEVLEAVAETLRNAPKGSRYDWSLTIDELRNEPPGDSS